VNHSISLVIFVSLRPWRSPSASQGRSRGVFIIVRSNIIVYDVALIAVALVLLKYPPSHPEIIVVDSETFSFQEFPRHKKKYKRRACEIMKL
jgi:hypothetical protein